MVRAGQRGLLLLGEGFGVRNAGRVEKMDGGDNGGVVSVSLLHAPRIFPQPGTCPATEVRDGARWERFTN